MVYAKIYKNYRKLLIKILVIKFPLKLMLYLIIKIILQKLIIFMNLNN